MASGDFKKKRHLNPSVAKKSLTGPGRPVRKGFRAVPFDDRITLLVHLPEFTPSGFGLYPLDVNKTRRLKP